MKIHNKKGQLVIVFLVLFVLGIIAAGIIVYKLSNLVTKTGQATNSFNELTKEIEELREGEGVAKEIVLDPGSLIIGFTKDSKAALYKFTTAISSKFTYSFQRPESDCDLNKSCLCLCRKVNGELSAEKGIYKILSCEPGELICKQFEHINFLDSQSLKDNKTSGELLFSEGFMYNYEVDAIGKTINGATHYFPRFTSRRSTLYLERKKNTVNVCRDGLPCTPTSK